MSRQRAVPKQHRKEFNRLKVLLDPKPKRFVIQVQLRKPCRRVTKYWAVNGKPAIFPCRESAELAMGLLFTRKWKFPKDWRIGSMSIENYDYVKDRKPYVYPADGSTELT